MLTEIERVSNELQNMVVEKDCIDEEVTEKTRELEDLQNRYYSLLKDML